MRLFYYDDPCVSLEGLLGFIQAMVFLPFLNIFFKFCHVTLNWLEIRLYNLF